MQRLILYILLAALPLGTEATAATPAATSYAAERCQDLLDVAYAGDERADTWVDTLNCVVSAVRELHSSEAGLGAAAETVQWCAVERSRLQTRLGQLDSVMERYRSDAAAGTEVPTELHETRRELQTRLADLQRSCSGQPTGATDRTPEIGTFRGILDRLEAALDGHAGRVSPDAWCRLYEARGITSRLIPK